MLFSDIYKGKTVLVTGHTGFKGSWLSLWLKKLGAKVIGIGLDPISDKSFYSVNNINEFIVDKRFDIRDLEKIKEVVEEFQPDFIFHLAAQAIVRRSYLNPTETWSTNLIGTIFCTREIIPAFVRSKSGRIINFSSIHQVIFLNIWQFLNHQALIYSKIIFNPFHTYLMFVKIIKIVIFNFVDQVLKEFTPS